MRGIVYHGTNTETVDGLEASPLPYSSPCHRSGADRTESSSDDYSSGVRSKLAVWCAAQWAKNTDSGLKALIRRIESIATS